MSVNSEQQIEQPAPLIDVQSLHAMGLGSVRHIYRLADAGKMPRPLKLGALVRWRRAEIEEWIAGGCKPVRHVNGGE